MVASSPSPSSSFFDFSPSASQDSDLLKQLGILPGLKELLTVRQVHALEHATVWVLSESPARFGLPASAQEGTLGGMSTEKGFYVYGEVETTALQQAVPIALRRIVSGEWNLAVHPRCGTNLAVGMLMTAGLALGAQFLLPKDPIGQLIGIGIAASTATQLAPEVGQVAQRYVTTAIPFNLQMTHIDFLGDRWGRQTHFVGVRWVD